MKMKRYLALASAAFVTCGYAQNYLSIQDIVTSAPIESGYQVSAIGYLCVDFATAYLSNVNNCSFDKGFKVPLILDRQEMDLARNISNGTQVLVKGKLRTPPRGAIKMTHGILLGYSIKVISLKSGPPAA